MSEPCPIERPLLSRARIGVLMGGQSAERDVSLRTGTAVHRSLVRRGYNAVAIDVGPTLARDLQDRENRLILSALEKTDWNQKKAAGLLRVNATTLSEKLKRLRIRTR